MLSLGTMAQTKWIRVNTQVGGNMMTFSLYQRQADSSFTKIDAKEEDSGTWLFDSLNAGIYRIHVDFLGNKYLPTWHPRKALWDEAGNVDLTSIDSFICSEGMLPNPAMLPGPGLISGKLTEGLLKAQGEPIKNTRVILLDSTNAVAALTRTNDSGNFSISNIPVGTYKIKVDLVNASTAKSKTVVLDSTNSTVSVDLTVNKTGPVNTALTEATTASKVVVYPNPATQVIYINAAQGSNVEVHNLSGKLVLSQTINSNSSIDVSTLANGIYFVKISYANEIAVRKFIKE